jgi:DNA-binding NarL/FixJ family response regulator
VSCVFTVVVADEELIFAEALTALLANAPELDVLPPVSDAGHLVEVITGAQPNLAIIGATLGAAITSGGHRRHPYHLGATRVLVVADEARIDDISDALRAGAAGWVAKSASSGELLDAARRVAAGDVYVPEGVLAPVVRNLVDDGMSRTTESQALASLTTREREVLGWMVAGLNRDEISHRLFLSPNTVRTHMQNLLRKLDVHSSLAAAAYGRRHGIRAPEADIGQFAAAP